MQFRRPNLTAFSIYGFICLVTAYASWAKLDQNDNALSDIWEASFPPTLGPSDDDDSDGFSNLEESQAGTDPRNNADFPRSPDLHFGDSQEVIHRWMSRRGVAYQVWASGDLQTWIPVGSIQTGTGSEMELSFGLATTFDFGSIQLQRWENLSSSGVSLPPGRSSKELHSLLLD
jgi:hypothetical protein